MLNDERHVRRLPCLSFADYVSKRGISWVASQIYV
jgi:hypothetical protein